jgi:hypothetical protein
MIRVDDDGHGLDRDSLDLIGRAPGAYKVPIPLEVWAERQRLAKTVRMPKTDRLIHMDSGAKVCNTTLHTLTEALASISSLGLLEITSKTARSRHTYTKVMKVSHLLLPTVIY